MTAAARVAANRQNAKASTGPRTAAGKARVAANAIRHGLAVPVNALPEFDVKISQLTKLLAGADASPSRLESARRVAEAEIDIRRVQSVRLRILDGLAEPRHRSRPAKAVTLVRLATKALRGDLRAGDEVLARQKKVEGPRDTCDEPAPVLARIIEAMPELARLDRYERRARSRRKFAIRKMDVLADC